MGGQTWTILAAMFATSATLAGLTVTAMNQLRTGVQVEIADLRTELKREIADTRTELKQELVEVREGLARVEQRTYELALNRPAS
jgi:hypothetical protein